MKKQKKQPLLYPGIAEAEKQRGFNNWNSSYTPTEAPNMIGLAPNYEKFKGWDIERVLVFLNID